MFGLDVMWKLPSISNYADGLSRYERIKPIRGSYPEVRPLGSRRLKHYSIVKRVQDGVNYIGCCLYGNEVVKFFEDGRTELSQCGYSTITTAAFIKAVVSSVRWCNVWDRHVVMTPWEDVTKRYIVGEKLVIHSDLSVEGEPCTIHKSNAAETREVLKRYKVFIDYAVNMAKVAGADVEFTTEMSKRIREYGLFFEVARLCEPDYELFAAYAAYFINTAKQMEHVYENGAWQRKTTLSIQTLKRTIREYIKRLYAAEIFEKVVLPHGEFKLDINRKYMRGLR